MNKQFNSFQQMLNAGVKGPAFRSFSDWAKTSIDGSQVDEKTTEIEAEPEIDSTEVVDQPTEPLGESKSVEKVVLEEPKSLNEEEASDVVQSLLEKLSDFDWDDIDFTKPIVPKKKQEKEPVQQKVVEEIKEKIEEKKEPIIENKIEPEIEKRSIPAPKPVSETKSTHSSGTQKSYKIFKDKNENFECHLSVEGTSLADAKVRIVLESDAWNFVFYGQIYGDGRCLIPIKKGIPLNEGATGNIKLEVIAEDQLFVGWQDEFRVVASKKVSVAVKEQKSIKVSFDHSINEDT